MPLREKQFWCVKCRKAVTIKNSGDICVKYFKHRSPKKNSRKSKSSSKSKKRVKTPALVAVCIKCNTHLTKFIKHSRSKSLERKYGKC